MQKHETVRTGLGEVFEMNVIYFYCVLQPPKEIQQMSHLGSIHPSAQNMFPIPQDKDATFPLWAPLLPLCPEMHLVLSPSSSYIGLKLWKHTNIVSSQTVSQGNSLYFRTSESACFLLVNGRLAFSGLLRQSSKYSQHLSEVRAQISTPLRGKVKSATVLQGKEISHDPSRLFFWPGDQSMLLAWSWGNGIIERAQDNLDQWTVSCHSKGSVFAANSPEKHDSYSTFSFQRHHSIPFLLLKGYSGIPLP